MPHRGRVSLVTSYAAACFVQATAVALPSRLPRLPEWLRGPVWSLVPPLAIGAVVLAAVAEPSLAEHLTTLAALATPPLALLAAWVVRPAPLALAGAVASLALAFLADGTAAEVGRAGAIALAAAPLGALLAAATPVRLLELAIVATVAIDIALVWGGQISEVSHALLVSNPPADLPRFQQVEIGSLVMGWGDVFLAGLLGGVVLSLRGSRATAALATAVAGAAFGLLFYAVDTLPSTVPVLCGLIATELRLRYDRVSM